MKRSLKQENGKARISRFPMSLFWTILAIMLVIGGIHQGILIGLQTAAWPEIVVIHIIVLYWLGAAVGLTLFIRARIRKIYDEPLQDISDAAKQVAKGDFTVRLQPLHSKEKQDYLDKMILDLNTMIEELDSIETLKTDFISNVSHEMKTPMAVIKNYSQLLQAESDPARRDEYAAVIEEAAGKMADLITNILRLNRLEQQKIVPEPAPYDLSRQLAECILGFDTALEKKDIELKADIDERLRVTADESLMELVWNNLLSNAIKFTEPGGAVTVREQVERGVVRVSVSDTGCGMDAESVRRIFDKFYQADTSHATEGNGLGLALVHRVLTLQGGEISVESTPGRGSTFTVTLPITHI